MDGEMNGEMNGRIGALSLYISEHPLEFDIHNLNLPENLPELSNIASENLSRRKDEDIRNLDLKARYAHCFIGTSGDISIDVQIRDANCSTKPDVLKIGNSEISVVARVFHTAKNQDGSGTGNAVVYFLGDNGKWYRSTGTSFTFNSENNTDYWKVGDDIQIVPEPEVNLYILNLIQVN